MTKPRPRNRSHSARSRNKNKATPDAGNWLWGQHAVAAALANPKRKLLRLVATRNGAQRLGAVGAKAEDTPPGEIDRLLPPGAVHQGIAGQFETLQSVAVEDVTAGGGRLVVVLDQVSDPHNLGAIFRSAAAFGAAAIVLQTRNAPEITGVAAKSAAGAIEMVEECRVVNIARALEHLNETGFHTVGLAGEGRATIKQAVTGSQKIALVMGAEGAGLRPGVAKACAELAHIPIDAAMESLNVSNAAAIALYEAAAVLEAS